jgi:hypothetical protein
MSLELINNLLELSEKNMNEGDYNQVAMLLKEKYKIIDDVDYETLLIVPPIEFFTDCGINLLTVKGFKYHKELKNQLFNGNSESKYLNGDFLLQVGEQEHSIKSQQFFNFIDVIIENELLNELSIENSFYGKVKKFDTLRYLSVYRNIEYDDDDEENYEPDNCNLFNNHVKTQFTKICMNTIQQTIMRLFRTK